MKPTDAVVYITLSFMRAIRALMSDVMFLGPGCRWFDMQRHSGDVLQQGEDLYLSSPQAGQYGGM